MIALHWLEDECSRAPTLDLDTLIDCFFLVDIAVSFNTGIYLKGGAEYIDRRGEVAWQYLKGLYIYIYIYVYIYTHIYICIYIYIERERERASERMYISCI